MTAPADDHRHDPPTTRDPELVSLLQMTEAFGLEQPVVLTMPGQVVTGMLTAGRSYFEELATAVQGEFPDDSWRGSLAGHFRQRSTDLADWGTGKSMGDLDPDGPDRDDLAPLPQVDFIHLRNAEVVTWPRSGQRLPLWRGRLSEVSGWSVGEFEDAPLDR